MKISACLITKDEENNVIKCIESFRESVDEIILVDTGSSDRTTEIAQGLGAQVYFYHWDNDFSNARNYAINKATGDWIVFLDADEYFNGDSGRNLREVLQQIHHNNDVDAVLCKCFDIDVNGKRVLSSYRTRIFRRAECIRYKGSIHEYLEKDGNKLVYWKAPEDQLLIYHAGYATESLSNVKYQRNLQLLLNELNSGEARPSIHAYLTYTYNSLKNYEMAINHARLFLESRSTSSSHNINVRLNLIYCMKKANYRNENIMTEIRESLSCFPEYPDLYWILAVELNQNGHFTDAIVTLENTLTFGFRYDGIETVSWPRYLPKVYSLMGDLYELKNDLPTAEKYFIRSLQENKWDEAVFNKLMMIVKKRDKIKLISLINTLYEMNDKSEVEFVLETLCKLRVKSVLPHYYDIWQRNFEEEDLTFFLFVLISNEKYEEAYQYFSNIYKKENIYWTGILAVVSALLSKKPDLIKEIGELINPGVKRIIDIFLCSERDAFLSGEESKDYLVLLNEFIYLEAEEEVNKLLELKYCFFNSLSNTLGDMLMNSGYYIKAAEQLTDALDEEGSDERELYFKTGFCYYKAFEYNKAAEYMKQAIQHGYEGNNIHEIVRWIQESINSPCENIELKV